LYTCVLIIETLNKTKGGLLSGEFYFCVNLKKEVVLNSHNLEDYALVQQYIAGDQACIEELIKRHKNRVYTYILLIVKNQQLAEDIFQDTFIKVIKSLNKGTVLR
jgi:hypothetical protein